MALNKGSGKFSTNASSDVSSQNGCLLTPWFNFQQQAKVVGWGWL